MNLLVGQSLAYQQTPMASPDQRACLMHLVKVKAQESLERCSLARTSCAWLILGMLVPYYLRRAVLEASAHHALLGRYVPDLTRPTHAPSSLYLQLHLHTSLHHR
jgi:hypothetical protein